MAFTDRLRQHPPFFWVALAVGTAILALYPFAITVLLRKGGLETSVGWTSARGGDGRMRVAHVDAGGPADGRLSVGVIVLTVNGQANMPRALGWVRFMDLQPGDRYLISVEQDGAPIEHELTASARSNPQKVWLIQVPLLAISFCFLATGLGVALISARARVARLYAIAAFAVAAQILTGLFTFRAMKLYMKIICRKLERLWSAGKMMSR